MNYSALIERLEKGSGEDRKIDGKLALLEISRLSDDERQRRALAAVDALERGATYPTGVPHYTGSLDAALAFAEAVLPGWTWACDATAPECGIDWECFAADSEPGVLRSSRFKGTSATHARAVLIATLKALQAKDTP